MANTKPAEPQEAPKRSTLQIVIEDGLLKELASGDIWNKPAEMSDDDFVKLVAGKIETLKKFKGFVGTAFKMFDEELTTRRNIQGADFLKGVEHFRKPRSGSSDNSLLSELDF